MTQKHFTNWNSINKQNKEITCFATTEYWQITQGMEKAWWPIHVKRCPESSRSHEWLNLQLKALAKAETLYDVEQNTQRTHCLKPLLLLKAVPISDNPVLITSTFSVNQIFCHSFFIRHSRSKHNSKNNDKNVQVYLVHGNSQIISNSYLSSSLGNRKNDFPALLFLSLAFVHETVRDCHSRKITLPHFWPLSLSFLSSLLASKFSTLLYI